MEKNSSRVIRMMLLSCSIGCSRSFMQCPQPLRRIQLPLPLRRSPSTCARKENIVQKLPMVSEKVREETVTARVTEEAISDVDARVLESMLRERKLDLNTEDDVRKLLERGTFKTVESDRFKEEEPVKSEYSSEALRTLADTKLWQKLSRKANDVAETLGLWVSNKVENDVKVLAALGLFAWDRAVNDVARALPAASKQAKKILILTNTSSFIDFPEEIKIPVETKRTTLESLVRPRDEFRDVTRDVMGILSGGPALTRTVGGGGRGLRTAAPAGTIGASERQRRAYTQSKKIEKQEQDVTRVAGGIVNAASELKRELKAEANTPGYRTEPVRNAIAAGIVGTGNLLRAARQEARLAAAKRKEFRALKQAGEATSATSRIHQLPERTTPISVTPERSIQMAKGVGSTDIRAANVVSTDLTESRDTMDAYALAYAAASGSEPIAVTSSEEASVTKDLVSALVQERTDIAERLCRCIDEPGKTWLAEDVVGSDEEGVALPEEDLRELFTRMILLRGEIYLDDIENDEPLEDVAVQLQSLRGRIEGICTMAFEKSRNDRVADSLRNAIYGGNEANLLNLLEMASNNVDQTSTVSEESNFYKATATSEPTTLFMAEIVDVIPEVMQSSKSFQNGVQIGDDVTDILDSEELRSYVAELITDDDFDGAVGQAKVTKEVTLEEDETEVEENPLVTMTLRSLDVVFFIFEKVVIAGIPKVIVIGKTVSVRLDAITQSGLGTKGWQKISTLADSRGRY